MPTVLIELHYLPSISWFSAVHHHDQTVVEKHEHYQKQSYRNRCYILGPQKVEMLIVPVSARPGKTAVTDVRIDYSQKWINNHWRTIQTSYGNAPYFEYYGPELEEVFRKKPAFLYDFNMELLTLCLKWLKMEAALRETDSFVQAPPPGVTDLRGVINPKKEDGCNRIYQSTEYPQVFGSKFVPNLSIIDLIFCQGPGASQIVKASAVE